MSNGTFMNYAKKIISPYGELFIVASDKALISLDNSSSELYKNATLILNHPILNLTEDQLIEYFNGNRFNFEIPLEVLIHKLPCLSSSIPAMLFDSKPSDSLYRFHLPVFGL